MQSHQKGIIIVIAIVLILLCALFIFKDSLPSVQEENAVVGEGAFGGLRSIDGYRKSLVNNEEIKKKITREESLVNNKAIQRIVAKDQERREREAQEQRERDERERQDRLDSQREEWRERQEQEELEEQEREQDLIDRYNRGQLTREEANARIVQSIRDSVYGNLEVRPTSLTLAEYRDGERNCDILCENWYGEFATCGKTQIKQEDRIISCNNQAATDIAIFRYNEVQCLCITN